MEELNRTDAKEKTTLNGPRHPHYESQDNGSVGWTLESIREALNPKFPARDLVVPTCPRCQALKVGINPEAFPGQMNCEMSLAEGTGLASFCPSHTADGTDGVSSFGSTSRAPDRDTTFEVLAHSSRVGRNMNSLDSAYVRLGRALVLSLDIVSEIVDLTREREDLFTMDPEPDSALSWDRQIEVASAIQEGYALRRMTQSDMITGGGGVTQSEESEARKVGRDFLRDPALLVERVRNLYVSPVVPQDLSVG
ncbi:hypothetical protein DFP72DRAFT_869388 [Ephemerocybe angulata]|uniref:Uncharacterized protein n=1 Tax=Ephemerocybe angulata TaxID=980116 RepID=A0A8H6IFT3_9AGAR|nr:hypothetical protein DFP72DRAFT_869388 [Tulosesus angulatus]